jgi:hypothetical protein
MSGAVLGFGTIIKRGNGAGTAETFTAIPEIIGDVKGPGMDLGMTEVTAHKTTDYYREFLPTQLDPGSITFAINFVYDDTQHLGLQSDAAGRVLRNFQIEWPDGDEKQFAGYVIKFNRTAGVESAIQMEVEIKISGEVTDVT